MHTSRNLWPCRDKNTGATPCWECTTENTELQVKRDELFFKHTLTIAQRECLFMMRKGRYNPAGYLFDQFPPKHTSTEFQTASKNKKTVDVPAAIKWKRHDRHDGHLVYDLNDARDGDGSDEESREQHLWVSDFDATIWESGENALRHHPLMEGLQYIKTERPKAMAKPKPLPPPLSAEAIANADSVVPYSQQPIGGTSKAPVKAPPEAKPKPSFGGPVEVEEESEHYSFECYICEVEELSLIHI